MAMGGGSRSHSHAQSIVRVSGGERERERLSCVGNSRSSSSPGAAEPRARCLRLATPVARYCAPPPPPRVSRGLHIYKLGGEWCPRPPPTRKRRSKPTGEDFPIVAGVCARGALFLCSFASSAVRRRRRTRRVHAVCGTVRPHCVTTHTHIRARALRQRFSSRRRRCVPFVRPVVFSVISCRRRCHSYPFRLQCFH